jgi:hypothetical protein
MRNTLNYIAALLSADAATAPVAAATHSERSVRRGENISGTDPQDPRTDHRAVR